MRKIQHNIWHEEGFKRQNLKMVCKMLHKYSNPKHKLFCSRLLMEVYAHNKMLLFLAHKWPALVTLNGVMQS